MGAWVFFYCTPVINLILSLQSEILLPVEWNSYTKKCVCIAPPPADCKCTRRLRQYYCLNKIG